MSRKASETWLWVQARMMNAGLNHSFPPQASPGQSTMASLNIHGILFLPHSSYIIYKRQSLFKDKHSKSSESIILSFYHVFPFDSGQKPLLLLLFWVAYNTIFPNGIWGILYYLFLLHPRNTSLDHFQWWVQKSLSLFSMTHSYAFPSDFFCPLRAIWQLYSRSPWDCVWSAFSRKVSFIQSSQLVGSWADGTLWSLTSFRWIVS